MWAQCPHKWKTAYVDGHRQFTDSIHTMFGTSMHEVIQTFLTVMYNDTEKSIELNMLSIALEKSLFSGQKYMMLKNVP